MKRRHWITGTLVLLAVSTVGVSEWLLTKVAVPAYRPCNGKTFLIVDGMHGGSADRTVGCQQGVAFQPTATAEDGTLTIHVTEAFATRIADPDWLMVRAFVGTHRDQPWPMRVIDALAPFSHLGAADGGTEFELPQPTVEVRGERSTITFDIGGEVDPETSILLGRRLQQRA